MEARRKVVVVGEEMGVVVLLLVVVVGEGMGGVVGCVVVSDYDYDYDCGRGD